MRFTKESWDAYLQEVSPATAEVERLLKEAFDAQQAVEVEESLPGVGFKTIYRVGIENNTYVLKDPRHESLN